MASSSSTFTVKPGSRFTGLIAAPFTAMDESGDVALDTIQQQAERLVHDGVKGVFVCGTTGEGALLSPGERMRVAQRWVDVAADRLKVIVSVGSESPALSRDLAEHAQKIGAAAIGCHAPSYFIPQTADDLVRMLQVVTSRSSLPFYYYHIPSFTHTRFGAAAVMEAAAPVMKNLAGVKYTHEDMMDFAACVELAGDRHEALFGRDEMFLCGLAFGATGAIGSTYNFAAPLYLDIYRHVCLGEDEEAGRLQLKSHQLIRTLLDFGGIIPAGKALMKLRGVDCGGVRAPFQALTSDAIRSLEKKLGEMNLLEIVGIGSSPPILDCV